MAIDTSVQAVGGSVSRTGGSSVPSVSMERLLERLGCLLDDCDRMEVELAASRPLALRYLEEHRRGLEDTLLMYLELQKEYNGQSTRSTRKGLYVSSVLEVRWR